MLMMVHGGITRWCWVVILVMSDSDGSFFRWSMKIKFLCDLRLGMVFSGY